MARVKSWQGYIIGTTLNFYNQQWSFSSPIQAYLFLNTVIKHSWSDSFSLALEQNVATGYRKQIKSEGWKKIKPGRKYKSDTFHSARKQLSLLGSILGWAIPNCHYIQLYFSLQKQKFHLVWPNVIFLAHLSNYLK